MKVVLTQEVKGLGQPGQIKEVADGYARNYLLPQGLATIATPGTIKEVEQRQAGYQPVGRGGRDDVERQHRGDIGAG